MQISFMTANYVARQIGYKLENWGDGDRSTQDHFKPIKTFGTRFEAYLKDIQEMGFEALDLWVPILNPVWATDAHIDTAVELLQDYNLTVVSLAGGFGNNGDELEAICELASALDAPVLGGSTPLLDKDRPLLAAMLEKHGLKFGLENHPEKTPQELLKKIGTKYAGILGVCVDTGWFGIQGYDAAKALEELGPHLMHVHLKDVEKVGSHDSCRFGAGIVPLRECVQVLKRIGYTGALSIEHEPDFIDPTEDCIADLTMVREWLNE